MSDTPAVVLAGGASARLGGTDKTRLELGGVPLLDRVLGLLTGPVVVVGPARPTCRDVGWVREEPPGGGPLAALAAGLGSVRGPRVLLLAADLPFLTAAALRVLEDAAGDGSAMAVDECGRDQPLLSCWDAAAVRTALPAEVAGGRLRSVTGAVAAVRVSLPGHPPPWWDCDTPQAWAQAVRWAQEGQSPLR